MREQLLYCPSCGVTHSVDDVARGDVLAASRTCRASEIESLIETATDLVVMATASRVWGIAEEALDRLLGLNDEPAA